MSWRWNIGMKASSGWTKAFYMPFLWQIWEIATSQYQQNGQTTLIMWFKRRVHLKRNTAIKSHPTASTRMLFQQRRGKCIWMDKLIVLYELKMLSSCFTECRFALGTGVNNRSYISIISLSLIRFRLSAGLISWNTISERDWRNGTYHLYRIWIREHCRWDKS